MFDRGKNTFTPVTADRLDIFQVLTMLGNFGIMRLKQLR